MTAIAYKQLKIEENFDAKDFSIFQNNRWFPYDSRSAILLILNQVPYGISISYLDAIMMKLQEEYYFPFNYFYIDGNSVDDIKEDVELLMNKGLIDKVDNSYFLNSLGEKLLEKIMACIRENPLEGLTNYPTIDTISRTVLEFINIPENAIKN